MTRFIKKPVPIILLCCIVVLIILVIIVTFNLIHVAKYEKVKAHITSIKTETYEGVGDSQTSKAHFVTYKFTYGGKSYEVTQQVFTKIGKHVGDVVILRCNPNNPTQIANMLLIKSCFVGICFLCFFIIIVFYKIFRGR